MTEETRLDPVLRDWLDRAPQEAPRRMVDAVLRAVDVTPQAGTPRSGGILRWKLPTWNRALVLATVAIAIAVVAVSTLLLGGDNRPMIGPAASPSSSPTGTPITSPPFASEGPLNSPGLTGLSVSGDAIAIAVGDSHACALTRQGAVMCWGRNASGQLGDGTTQSRSVPVAVVGLAGGVRAISLGADQSCALTAVGGVQCWGENGVGELGNGTTDDSAAPVDVVGLTSGIAAISVGGDHACALTIDGGLKCWGEGRKGQLGSVGSTRTSVPVDVAGLTSGVLAISSGESHTLAITAGGAVKGWGCNCGGQLGNGTTEDVPLPVDVVGLASGIAAIAAGHVHSCAVTSGGGVKCWGDGAVGKLGNGGVRGSPVPVDVTGLGSGVRGVDAGGLFTCAVLTGGGLKCWGDNLYGELGDGTATDRRTPADVAGLSSGVENVAIGESFACALTTGGGVLCWGKNTDGQLGNGETLAADHLYLGSTPGIVAGLTSALPVPTAPPGSPSPTPLSVSGDATSIAAGDTHTCAIVRGGGVKCWGDNFWGQLGNGAKGLLPDGSNVKSTSPVDVVGLGSGVIALSAGFGHTCALTSAGAVKCWGLNGYGGLGDGTTTDSATPVDVIGLQSDVIAITAGAAWNCALTSGGAVKCWGGNGEGQLGDGSTTSRLNAVDVSGLSSGVAAVAAGGLHACAVLKSGAVKCWGLNDFGQLGDGSTISRLEPVDTVELSSGAVAVVAGNAHTCVLTSAGGVRCWGYGREGQLGNGAFADSITPVDVSGLQEGVTAIAAGTAYSEANGSHTCALTSVGGVMCWGLGSAGQLGYGSRANRNTPVAVAGLASGVAAIAVTGAHTCALTDAGGVACWGENVSGQLGDGSTISSTTPVVVSGL